MPEKLRIVFAGGGTAGHLYPAFNLAKVFEKNGDCQCLFFGTQRGIEAVKVPERGYELVLLNIRGFQRRISIQNFLFPLRLVASLLKSRRVLKKFKPHLVIGTGGYVMGPVLKMAVKLKFPVFIQEQNSFPGVTTRMLAKDAKAIFIAYEEAKKHVAKESNTVLCGNPVVVPEKLKPKAEALSDLGLKDNLKTILVFGGSQGASSINMAIKSWLEKSGLPQGVQLLWQSGTLQFEQYKKWLAKSNLENVVLKPFINDMWAAYQVSEFSICRAGAMSISELTIAGLPSILVPLKSAAGNHQFKNARAMEEKNGAVLIEDNDGLPTILSAKINDWIDHPKKLEPMKNSLAKIAQPEAAGQIVAEIKRIMKV
ncbi:MAG: undecaprenyldiphospho-muramoylpentapeptide beta-N-acetylglucosaminyltransferase [Calditrichaeota bacterium]|nr:MAG: undecaprenyldiphospho-muramoylpentapeptide beta-N-acetylglucosaminyltransferase [Calditrichota bacterium]MBL1206557.1 undecaprenyldiphospho-muramoylpentapeptide beta-N-acetylglucosaminyltransferase [Calditrichota bacterium]NOG46384.1 undecaprenyldiphospho-muramoylpentapeptide beta-N-acetylglucosaminyltransferase [Calditrichota bacterium]